METPRDLGEVMALIHGFPKVAPSVKAEADQIVWACRQALHLLPELVLVYVDMSTLN
ncbi:MAG: hypothetical protein ACRERR_05160 [Moraxellaceae bacterium]